VKNLADEVLCARWLENPPARIERDIRGRAFFGHQSDMKTPEASRASGDHHCQLFQLHNLVAGTRNCLDLLLRTTLNPPDEL
jgi:hypothetical protein